MKHIADKSQGQRPVHGPLTVAGLGSYPDKLTSYAKHTDNLKRHMRDCRHSFNPQRARATEMKSELGHAIRYAAYGILASRVCRWIEQDSLAAGFFGVLSDFHLFDLAMAGMDVCSHSPQSSASPQSSSEDGLLLKPSRISYGQVHLSYQRSL